MVLLDIMEKKWKLLWHIGVIWGLMENRMETAGKKLRLLLQES